MASDSNDQVVDKESTLLNLWIRFSAGESLVPSDLAHLRHALAVNPQFRAIVLQDERMDQLLRFMDESSASVERESDDESFTAAVLRRCTESSSTEDARQSTNLPSAVDLVFRNPDPSSSGFPRHRKNHRSNRRSLLMRSLSNPAVALAVVTLTIVVSAGWWFALHQSSQQGQASNQGQDDRGPVNQPPRQPPEQKSPEKQNVQYARVIQSGEAVLTGAQEPGSITNEQMVLEQGSVRLECSGGAVVDIFGPAQFQMLSPGELKLDAGELSANVPSPAKGFRVRTPNAVVVDLGTVFDVAVSPEGMTEAEVRQGTISAESHEQESLQKWQLTADELNQVTFFASLPVSGVNSGNAVQPRSPISSAARGFGNQFSGLISFNSRTVKFSDEPMFEATRIRINARFAEAPLEAAEEWSHFVELQTSDSPVNGEVTLNGIRIELRNLSEAVLFSDRLFNNEQKSGMTTDSFRGILSINGQERQFENRDQYDAAIRELLRTGE
ncbi:MAG: FecR domain-containing protein [Planctomyces sp.]|nr:FecR domain-containing protein [Planctomyces sp.]